MAREADRKEQAGGSLALTLRAVAVTDPLFAQIRVINVSRFWTLVYTCTHLRCSLYSCCSVRHGEREKSAEAQRRGGAEREPTTHG